MVATLSLLLCFGFRCLVLFRLFDLVDDVKVLSSITDAAAASAASPGDWMCGGSMIAAC